jgi:hypothetical protein
MSHILELIAPHLSPEDMALIAGADYGYGGEEALIALMPVRDEKVLPARIGGYAHEVVTLTTFSKPRDRAGHIRRLFSVVVLMGTEPGPMNGMWDDAYLRPLLESALALDMLPAVVAFFIERTDELEEEDEDDEEEETASSRPPVTKRTFHGTQVAIGTTTVEDLNVRFGADDNGWGKVTVTANLTGASTSDVRSSMQLVMVTDGGPVDLHDVKCHDYSTKQPLRFIDTYWGFDPNRPVPNRVLVHPTIRTLECLEVVAGSSTNNFRIHQVISRFSSEDSDDREFKIWLDVENLGATAHNSELLVTWVDQHGSPMPETTDDRWVSVIHPGRQWLEETFYFTEAWTQGSRVARAMAQGTLKVIRQRHTDAIELVRQD